MRLKIIDREGHSICVELSDGRCCEKQLYFVADKDADLSLESVHSVCTALQTAFGGSLMWDIVAELPEPLLMEDGVAAYLFISQ